MEPAALVPLQMLAPRGCAVLVGDPQQLPATVISRAAQQAGLPLSLFQRLQQVALPVKSQAVSCLSRESVSCEAEREPECKAQQNESCLDCNLWLDCSHLWLSWDN